MTEIYPGKTYPENSQAEKRLSPEEEKVKLNGLLFEISKKLRLENIPITDDCRIDMGAYAGIYRELGFDKSEVERYKELFKNEFHDENEISPGEKLEMLKTIVMDKFIGKDFFVARSSSFDDLKNHIDNVILEKATGKLVCAVDDVREDAGSRKEEKRERLFRKLREEKGNVLKYSLETDKGGKGKIGRKQFDIPVFYLALTKKEIDEAIAAMGTDPQQISDKEKVLFEKFKVTLKNQFAEIRSEFGQDLGKIKNKNLVRNILNAESAVGKM